MAYRVLEVTIQSAKNLRSVNLFSRLEVYAVVTISGDPLTRQSTQPDPYGGRHPCWNATFQFHVPPTAAAAGSNGCLHVLLRTERALGDRDVGEVIVPLADILAGTTAADPGPRPQQCASYQVRKVHRCEPRGTLKMAYRLGPVVAVQAARAADEHGGAAVVAYPVARPFYPSPYYAYRPPAVSLPPPPTQASAGSISNPYNFVPAYPQASSGHDTVHQRSPSSAGPINAYNSPAYPQTAGGHGAVDQQAPSNTYNNSSPAYSQGAGTGYEAKGQSDGSKVDFGVGLGAGFVSGAIGGILASDMMSEAAAYSYGYRAGLADGGAALYSKYSQVQDKVNSNRTMV